MKGFQTTNTILETHYGVFDLYCFSWSQHEEDNLLCLVKGPVSKQPLVRIQSACYTAEIFRSLDCDCHEQLEESLKQIQIATGILVYMLCDGRGAGLFKKIQGLELGRTKGLDTSAAYSELGLAQDPRDYARVAQVLRWFKVDSIRLLTNNPRKASGLEAHGICVTRQPIEIPSTSHSYPYLRTKAIKMGHLLAEFLPSGDESQT
jgi:GTP cyclohydrolase II